MPWRSLKISKMKDALNAALTYLSRRILTRRELIQKLEKKGFPSQDIEAAIERLLEWGYLSDQEYARTYCLSKQMNYSRKRITYELKGRGIEEGVIEQALQETYLPGQEAELCRRHAQKLWTEESRRWETSYQHKKSYEKIPRGFMLRQRVGQKLIQKGYPQEMVFQIIEEIREE